MTEPVNPDEDLQMLLALDLEYRLTIASRMTFFGDPCACVPYFVGRRDVLFPEIIKKAKAENRDVDDVFHEFAQKVHARHE